MKGLQRLQYGNEDGAVLVYVLMVCIAIVVLLSGMVAASAYALTISRQRIDYTKCYAVTSSVSRSILASLERGNQVASKQLRLVGYDVVVSTSNAANQTTVFVSTSTGVSSDTISFTYDTISHRLIAWQDNGPGRVG